MVEISKIERIIGTCTTVIAGVATGIAIQQSGERLDQSHPWGSPYGQVMVITGANLVKSALRDAYCYSQGQTANQILQGDAINVGVFNACAAVGYGISYLANVMQK